MDYTESIRKLSLVKSTLHADNVIYSDVNVGEKHRFNNAEMRYTSRPVGYKSCCS